MPISDVVKVNISRESPSIKGQGFGRAMVLGLHTRFTPDRVRLYSDLDAVVADGFISSDPEFKAAAALFGQEIKPRDIAIGRRVAAVAQVNRVDVTTVENSMTYTVTINGVLYTYISDINATALEIRDGLIAAINAGSEPVTAAIFDADSLSLTADVAGEGFTSSVTANLTNTTTTPNHGFQQDLDEIHASGDLGQSWYALVITSRTTPDIMEAAAWVEARRRIFGACSFEAGVLTNAVGNVALRLKNKSYARTFYFYSVDQANFPEAALLGGLLPLEVGSWTAALKTLVGITKDQLTGTQIANLELNFATYYVEIGGVNVTQGGKVAQGEWIDIIVDVDFIQARAEESIFALLTSVPKVPFTDEGISQVVNALRSVLMDAESRGILAADDDTPAFSIVVPRASSFTPSQKQTRILNGITFTGLLAGAIHEVEINGTVSV